MKFFIKLKKIVKYVINSLWAIPMVLFIRFISNIVLVRFGTFTCSRIGHFVPDSIEQITRIKSQTNNTVDLFWIPDLNCNRQWAKMVSRSLPVFHWVKYLYIWNKVFPGGDMHIIKSSLNNTELKENKTWIVNKNIRIPFNNEEFTKASLWLSRIGWKEGEPFVCVLVRDTAYLQNYIKGNWEYHSYRDSDISTYVKALEWLAERGVWIIRMGKIMEKRIPSDHPKIIDYSFMKDRNDLIDIWLFANCNFCISTSTGPDWISCVYKKPILFLNFPHLRLMWTWCEAVHAPKIMKWKNNGAELTASEYWINSFQHSEKYINAGINLLDLSSDMILETVKEFWYRYNNKWEISNNEIKNNKKIKEIFKLQPDYLKCHGKFNSKSMISSSWLDQKNKVFYN